MTAVPAANILWSYAYARKTDIGAFVDRMPIDRLRFFADSGAHSARTLGIDLRIEDYAKWLVKYHDCFTIYCNLDVIGAPAATRRNQRILEDEYGLYPMPVFHTGEPFSVLESYLDQDYTYIALGKLLGNSASSLRPWLARAFAMAEGRAVYHGFGMTNWRVMREFPFYSVDSSSWTSGYRYGTLRLFDRGRWVTVNLRDRSDATRHRLLLASYGIRSTHMTRAGYQRTVIGAAAATTRYRANEYLRGIHGTIKLPPGKGYPPNPSGVRNPVIRRPAEGLHTYLAESTETSHRLSISALAHDAEAGYPYTADA